MRFIFAGVQVLLFVPISRAQCSFRSSVYVSGADDHFGYGAGTLDGCYATISESPEAYDQYFYCKNDAYDNGPCLDPVEASGTGIDGWGLTVRNEDSSSSGVIVMFSYREDSESSPADLSVWYAGPAWPEGLVPVCVTCGCSDVPQCAPPTPAPVTPTAPPTPTGIPPTPAPVTPTAPPTPTGMDDDGSVLSPTPTPTSDDSEGSSPGNVGSSKGAGATVVITAVMTLAVARW
ncbi:unnamed protein product [Ectocarpus sp. 8 AP-2014]